MIEHRYKGHEIDVRIAADPRYSNATQITASVANEAKDQAPFANIRVSEAIPFVSPQVREATFSKIGRALWFATVDPDITTEPGYRQDSRAYLEAAAGIFTEPVVAKHEVDAIAALAILVADDSTAEAHDSLPRSAMQYGAGVTPAPVSKGVQAPICVDYTEVVERDPQTGIVRIADGCQYFANEVVVVMPERVVA